MRLELSHALARQAEIDADLLERLGCARQTVVTLEHVPLAVGQARQCAVEDDVTLIALQLPTVFTGAVVTEQIFRVPGIGALLISSIQNNDTPVIMAIVMVFAFILLCSVL